MEIGAHCAIYSHNTINEKIPNNTITKGTVILKKGCCIGANSVILPGVIIKENELVKIGSTRYMRKGYIREDNQNGCTQCFEDICLNQGFNIRKLEYFKHYLNECPYIEFDNQKECDMYE